MAGYELFKTNDTTAEERLIMPNTEPANKDEIEHFMEHLETELEYAGYFRIPEKKPRMMRNLRNIFARTLLTSQEIRTLHGVLSDLTRK